MVDFVKRADWGARRPTRTPRNIPAGDRRGVVYHWTGDAATSIDSHDRPHSQCDNDARNIQRYHMDSRGWSDFAYSFHVCIHGVVYEVRGWGWDQFANGSPDKDARLGADKDWYTIHFALGRGGVPTKAMLEAGRWIVAEARRRSRGVAKEVRRHDEFKRKVCPGPALTAEVKRIVADGLGADMPNFVWGAWPLPDDHWFGEESSDRRNHSGFHEADREGVRDIQEAFHRRGWGDVEVTGRFSKKDGDRVEKFRAARADRLGRGRTVTKAVYRALDKEPVR